MVTNNEGVPEPRDNGEETLSANHNGNIILGTDSDSDEEDVALAGYEPLPLVPPDDVNDESSDSEDDSGLGSGGQPSNDESLPPINRIERTLVKEVWAECSPAAVDIKMDSDKVDEVRQAMVNVTLPPSSIPDWASNIPEEQWKQHLISRLHDLQKNSK